LSQIIQGGLQEDF